MIPKVLVSFRDVEKVEPYLAALRDVAIEPVTSGTDVEGVQGVLFTGGSDIDPEFYGQTPDLKIGHVDRERDVVELALLKMADAAGLPVLCICRGLQLLNVHRGGTLVQHLPESERHRRTEGPKSAPVHGVRMVAGSKLAEILGTLEAQVNSRHHQAVDALGRGLIVTARDIQDGVIEGVEDPGKKFMVGVQWHTEDQAPVDEAQRRLFAAFAESL